MSKNISGPSISLVLASLMMVFVAIPIVNITNSLSSPEKVVMEDIDDDGDMDVIVIPKMQYLR